MIIVSAGIRPRDELARELRPGGRRARRRRRRTTGCRRPIPRSSPSAKCALHGGMIYGLVAPGYEMAEIVAANLTGGDRQVRRRRPVDQAQADGRRRGQLRRLRGQAGAGHAAGRSKIRSRGVYKKLLFSLDGTRLLGGILVGDASDYGTLLALLPRATSRCPCQPGELMVAARRQRPRRRRRRDARQRPRSARATTSARGRSARRFASRA